MCPYNTTNLQDGSPDCPAPVLPGSNMTARYAVIVSFGVYLNGTSLDDIAQKVGRPNPEYMHDSPQGPARVQQSSGHITDPRTHGLVCHNNPVF